MILNAIQSIWLQKIEKELCLYPPFQSLLKSQREKIIKTTPQEQDIVKKQI